MKHEFESIRKRVLDANLLLPEYGLVTFTWGNVSEIDRSRGILAIKPSGVEYDNMTLDDIVIVDLEGNCIDGTLSPSSDLKTHIYLYNHFPDIGGIVHTHSTWATAFAQAGLPIDSLGTTHADTFYGAVPCTRVLTQEEIADDYELNTGKVIVETFKDKDYRSIPACLVQNHGPFVWGLDALDAVHNSVVLETVANMNYITSTLSGLSAKSISQALLDKHYQRKHGKDAYYGQR